jgi:hypothetical protein
MAVMNLRNIGWLPLFGVALMQTVAALMLMMTSGARRFEEDTGVAWAELSAVFPTAARQIAGMQQNLLVFGLVIGLFSLLVCYFAFRTGQRWAWFAMWLLPATIAAGAVVLAQMNDQLALALMGGAFSLAAVAGLLVSIPAFFLQPAQGSGTAARQL